MPQIGALLLLTLPVAALAIHIWQWATGKGPKVLEDLIAPVIIGIVFAVTLFYKSELQFTGYDEFCVRTTCIFVGGLDLSVTVYRRWVFPPVSS